MEGIPGDSTGSVLLFVLVYQVLNSISPKIELWIWGSQFPHKYYRYRGEIFHCLFLKHNYLWSSRNISSPKQNYEYREDNILPVLQILRGNVSFLYLSIEMKIYFLPKMEQWIWRGQFPPKIKWKLLVCILGGIFSSQILHLIVWKNFI